MRKNIFIGIIFMILAGCASTTTFQKQKPDSQNSPILYLYRPSKMYALMSAPEIRLNGKKILSLSNGKYAPVVLTPGKQVVSVSGLTIDKSASFFASKGECYFLRMELIGTGYTVTSSSDLGSAFVGTVFSGFLSSLMSKGSIDKPEETLDRRVASSQVDPELFFVKEKYAVQEIEQKASRIK